MNESQAPQNQLKQQIFKKKSHERTKIIFQRDLFRFSENNTKSSSTNSECPTKDG